MKIDVEKELEFCVARIGGRLVRELVGESPSFNDADYLFDNYGVVAELKILAEDKMHDPRIREKMTKIYREASARGEANVIVYGESMITAGDLSPEYSRKLGEVYRAPIQRAIKKANRQIRQTKEHLKRKSHHGLLILVNDAHTALEPQHIQWILGATLRDREYSSIDSILYFTANLTATHPELDTKILIWAEWDRPNFPTIDQEFRTALRREWDIRFQEITGEAIPTWKLKHAEVNKLRNEPKR